MLSKKIEKISCLVNKLSVILTPLQFKPLRKNYASYYTPTHYIAIGQAELLSSILDGLELDSLKALDTFQSCFNFSNLIIKVHSFNLVYSIFEIHFEIYQVLNIQDSVLNKIATVFLLLFWQSSFFCCCHKCATIFCLGTVADFRGFHLYLFELAFINQFYPIMTRLVQLSLAND